MVQVKSKFNATTITFDRLEEALCLSLARPGRDSLDAVVTEPGTMRVLRDELSRIIESVDPTPTRTKAPHEGRSAIGTPFAYGPCPIADGQFVLGMHGNNILFDDPAQVQGLREALDAWAEQKLDEKDPPETYWVQSRSRPALNHKVTRRRNAVWSCTCESQTNRGGTCPHIMEAADRRFVERRK